MYKRKKERQMGNKLDKFKAYMDSERVGAETFEYVLIVAILVTLIMFLFQIVGPVFQAKMESIASAVNNTGNWITN